jgi:hypothetical protein
VESDPELSKTLTGPSEPNPGAGDWYVLIDGTELAAVRAFIEARVGDEVPGASTVSRSTYTLIWDLAKSDLGWSGS